MLGKAKITVQIILNCFSGCLSRAQNKWYGMKLGEKYQHHVLMIFRNCFTGCIQNFIIRDYKSQEIYIFLSYLFIYSFIHLLVYLLFLLSFPFQNRSLSSAKEKICSSHCVSTQCQCCGQHGSSK